MKSNRERAEKILEGLLHLSIGDCDLISMQCNDEMMEWYKNQYVAIHLIEDMIEDAIESSEVVQRLRDEIEDLNMQLEHEQECRGTCEGEDAD